MVIPDRVIDDLSARGTSPATYRLLIWLYRAGGDAGVVTVERSRWARAVGLKRRSIDHALEELSDAGIASPTPGGHIRMLIDCRTPLDRPAITGAPACAVNPSTPSTPPPPAPSAAFSYSQDDQGQDLRATALALLRSIKVSRPRELLDTYGAGRIVRGMAHLARQGDIINPAAFMTWLIREEPPTYEDIEDDESEDEL